MKFRKSFALRCLLGAAVFLGLALNKADAQYSAVKLYFALTTAPEAATGSPVGYVLNESFTGTTAVMVGIHLDVIAPDGVTTYQVYPSLTQKLTTGASITQHGTFTTNFTNQTGAFTAKAYLTAGAKGGMVGTAQTVTVNVIAPPSNGVYANIGGLGPESAGYGFPYDFSAVTANLGSSAMTLQTKTTLIMTDMTEYVLSFGTATTINPGANAISTQRVTHSQYTLANGGFKATGTFGLRVDVMDVNNNNNIVATETHNFVRSPLPASYPTFTDKASTNGLAMADRMTMMMAGCGGYFDFMAGGSGAAVADYDGDGFEDLYTIDMSGMGHLWHNKGDGTFEDVTMMAGIPMIMMQSAASWADIDNDGNPDLLILTAFMGNPVLLHNDGNGMFTDISATSGITNPVPQNNYSATWGDYDGDGLLDLYITVHADCTGTNTNDHLYHNMGGGVFQDVTNLLGGSTAPQVTGRGLVTLFYDYNGDGRPDLLVGNDTGGKYGPNVLWQNGGAGGTNGWMFNDVSKQTGMNLHISSMGIGISDYNHQGQYSTFITNLPCNYLLTQNASGTYTNANGLAGIYGTPGDARLERCTLPAKNGGTGNQRGWSTAFYDFNNDTWEDIYVAGDLGGAGLAGAAPIANGLFLNNGDGTFSDISRLSKVTGSVQLMPTAVFADFNNDGWMDVWEQGMMGAGHLYMNNGGTNNWLEVKLIGNTSRKSNRDAVGARLVASVKGVNLLRQVTNGGQYQGNSTLVQHFGLGSATQVDTLTIAWPSGQVQVLGPYTANQKVTITEP